MSLKLGSRRFAPRPLTTLLTLIVLGILLSLGRWQLRRADEKRLLFDSFASGTDATVPIDRSTAPLKRYQHIEARGHYDASRQLLVDNMVHAEHAGYYVITPFELADGGWLLVNRGWVPVGASRSVLPDVAVGGAERSLRGRADNLPAPGIRLRQPALRPPFPVVASFPSHDDVAGLLHETQWTQAAESMLLDAGEPDGYVRDWQPPGFPPLRHIGYAVQWFGLAAALVVIYFVTNTRRVQA